MAKGSVRLTDTRVRFGPVCAPARLLQRVGGCNVWLLQRVGGCNVWLLAAACWKSQRVAAGCSVLDVDVHARRGPLREGR